jgi:acetate kinase
MGMTPLEGLIMGTRCGDIDPSLPFYLMRQTVISPEDVENLLNRESGLKGICGVSDVREIQDRAAKGNERAKLAMGMFSYRIKKYVGAYCAVLGRVDAIVFTGGIGENSAAVRRHACEGLEHMGISLEERKNEVVSGKVSEIQREGSPVRILVIQTDEEREIAQQTVSAIEGARRLKEQVSCAL